jgi:hypothetical protein
MIPWLKAKLDVLTEEFLGGDGFGVIFEVSYLAYLECFVVARGGDPNQMWADFKAECVKETPEGEEPSGHYLRTEGDRPELVRLLQAFRANYDPPAQAPAPPISRPPDDKKPAQKEPVPSSTGGTKMLDIFDLLDGDES